MQVSDMEKNPEPISSMPNTEKSQCSGMSSVMADGDFGWDRFANIARSIALSALRIRDGRENTAARAYHWPTHVSKSLR